MALQGNEHQWAKKFNSYTVSQITPEILLETQQFYDEISQTMSVNKITFN